MKRIYLGLGSVAMLILLLVSPIVWVVRWLLADSKPGLSGNSETATRRNRYSA